MSYSQKHYRPIRREEAKITPMKDKGFEPGQMRPTASQSDKRFMSYGQKQYRPIRREMVKITLMKDKDFDPSQI